MILIGHITHTIVTLTLTLQERWDPTDIIASSFPVDVLKVVAYRTCRSVMIPTEFILTTILLSYQGSKYGLNTIHRDSIDIMIRSAINYASMMAGLNVIIFCIATLCGASPFHNIQHTMLATVYFSTLAFGYIQPNLKSSQDTIEKVVFAPDYSNELNFMENLVNEMNCWILYATCGVTIPFMILNILDHGDQLQRWPLPIIVGSLCGHIIGVVVGTLVGVYRLHRTRFGKKMTVASSPSPSSHSLGSPFPSPSKERIA